MNVPVPSFDFWSIAFLVSAIQGLFVALMLWQWRRGDAMANRILACLMVLFSLTMLEYVLYWTHYLYFVPHFADLSVNWAFFMGPIVWFYLRRIFERRNFSRLDWLHLLPFAFGTLMYAPWTFMSVEAKQAVWNGEGRFPLSPLVLNALIVFRSVSMVSYGIWTLYYIFRQARVHQSRRWALLINGFFLGYALAYISYFVLVRYPFFNAQWDYHISVVMSLFIWLIAWSGYTQPAVFDGYALTEPEGPAKYKHSGLSAEAGRSLLKALDSLMEEEKKFQDPEISLEELASCLHSNKHHVSQIINSFKCVSFFEYINVLRIEEAKKILSETTRKDLHIIEVAYAVGFNNKVSFNAAFKRVTGMTPTQFREMNR